MEYVEFDIDFINSRSPYKVRRTGGLSCRFDADNGLTYEVGFTEDYNLRDEGVFQFFITEINKSTSYKDDKVRQTIWIVIEEFFRCNQSVMIYICDINDGRQGVRNRLFAYWFEEYEHKEDYSFVPESLTVDGISYFASIIVKKTHPEHNTIIKEFEEFAAQLKDKWE